MLIDPRSIAERFGARTGTRLFLDLASSPARGPEQEGLEEEEEEEEKEEGTSLLRRHPEQDR